MKKLKLSQRFNSIYSFTTENIKGYLESYDFTNQRVLTVGASGDHILNLILLGATKIDYFDINPFTEFYVELKIAAVKALDYNEFVDYFYASNWVRMPKYPSMSILLYQKLAYYLPMHIRIFFDVLYLEFTGEEIRFSKLFTEDELPNVTIKEVNLYLEENAFYQLKEKLLQHNYKLHFYEENLKNLPSKLKKKYHAILLSNIAKYLLMMYDEDIEPQNRIAENYIKLFKHNIEQLSCYVLDNGIIFVAYLYDVNQNQELRIPFVIYDTYLRNLYFPYPEYQLHKCLGISQLLSRQNLCYEEEEIKDAVLIYQKKN